MTLTCFRATGAGLGGSFLLAPPPKILRKDRMLGRASLEILRDRLMGGGGGSGGEGSTLVSEVERGEAPEGRTFLRPVGSDTERGD